MGVWGGGMCRSCPMRTHESHLLHHDSLSCANDGWSWGECRYVVAGRQAGEPLQESPYLMHPVDCNTVGLYKTPVAILDFASLYPSLYRAHNLCYSTLLHPDDVMGLPPEQTTPVLRPKANVKSHFVKAGLRKGILPSILAALIEARGTTRAALKEASDPGKQ